MRAHAAAAVLLLAAAWYWREHLSDDNDELELAPDWTDEVTAALSTLRNTIAPTPVQGMRTSAAGLAHLKRRESLSLTPYRLGDGGSTIGWGRYYPDNGPPPPDRIDRATAEAWFVEDVRERGERWVTVYVDVPLLQHQFDALVSMAYNLSPRSFRKIAAAVNAGEDPANMALQFIRQGTHLEAGLRTRRQAELAMYRTGRYA